MSSCASSLRLLTNVSVAACLCFASAASALCATPMTGVSLSLRSNLQQTVASASVGYTATIQNTGSLPYNDATIAVEVRDAASGAIVERFMQHGVSVAAGSSAEPTFVWHVSGALAPGAYQVEAILVPAGVSYGDAFTDQRLPHATVPMKISSGPASAPVFSGPLSMTSGTLTASMTNPANAPYRGTITWRLWRDAGQPLEQPQDVEMLPQGSASATYALPETDAPTYVEAVVSSQGSVQAVTGAWVAHGTVSPTNTSCNAGGGMSDTLAIFALVAILVIVLIGAAYLRKYRTPPSAPPQVL